MKFLLEHAGRHAEDLPAPLEREIEVQPGGGGFLVAMEGTETEVAGTVGADTRALIGGKPVEASVRREGDLVVVELRGRRYEYRVRDARAPRLARRRQADAARGEVHAPMPGLVVEILAEVGDVVEAGRPLVVVEAMKMQNALPAPLAGRVTAISVAAGTAVESGALLLTVTPEEG